MVKAFFAFLRVFVTVPFFELAGALLVTAAAWGAWGIWAGLGVAGLLAFVKSFDLALVKK